MLSAAVMVTALANPNSFFSIAPGGETRCLHGDEYSFMARKGTVNKIVFEFEGGGACWNAATCGLGTCQQKIDAGSKVNFLNGANSGVHDGNNEANPFKEYHHVFIPYCTCDVHTGVNDIRYTLRTMHHRGHINWQAALKWTKENFPTSPEAVAVTGCSAGSAGALLNWAFLAEAYPSARHYVFGDAMLGVMTPSQYEAGFKNWGLTLPFHIPGLSPDEVSKYKPDMSCYLIEKMHAAYPTAAVSAYTSNADSVQTGFYQLGGGGFDWTTQMRSLVSCFHENVTTSDDIYTYIHQGTSHCHTQSDIFYSTVTEGVNLATWVSDIVNNNKEARPRVDCLNSGECTKTLTSPPLDPLFVNSTQWLPNH